MERSLEYLISELFSVFGNRMVKRSSQYKYELQQFLESKLETEHTIKNYEDTIIKHNLFLEIKINIYLSLLETWLKERSFPRKPEWVLLEEQIRPMSRLLKIEGKYYNTNGQPAPDYVQKRAESYAEIMPIQRRLIVLENDYMYLFTLDKLFMEAFEALCHSKSMANQLFGYDTMSVIEEICSYADFYACSILGLYEYETT